MSEKESEKKANDKLATTDTNEAASLTTVERSFLELDLLNDKDKALDLMGVLVKGKVAKDRSKEELLACYLKSRELGIGFVSAADHMHVVRGKMGVDIHIIKALLLKAGSNIWWECIRDFEPQYKYTDGNNVWIKPADAEPEKFLPRECMYVYDKATTDKAKARGLIPVWKDVENGLAPIDWVTTYKFSREISTKSGTKVITEQGTFSWLEAVKAKLPMDSNGQYNPDSNWQKYTKLMIDHRAFTFGARSIGADLLMGLYETKELMDANNMKYTVDSEAVVVEG